MSKIGNAAIAGLAEVATKEDPEASSHWQKYHEGFQFTGAGFEGLSGFGGNLDRTLPRKIFHGIFQTTYRRIGRTFADFARIESCADRITCAQGRVLDLDVLRQVITLSFLLSKTPDRFGTTSVVCVIGDGFASMTSLLVESGASQKVILVNLTKTLLVDLWFLKKWMGDRRFSTEVALAENETGLKQAISDQNIRVVAVQATSHELIRNCEIDIAINIASMQEMDLANIEAYFSDLRNSDMARTGGPVFYCCNREEKNLPDGTVTRIMDYPWQPDDIVHVDEICGWHQKYYSRQFPFYHRYDGPIRHRLVKLARSANS